MIAHRTPNPTEPLAAYWPAVLVKHEAVETSPVLPQMQRDLIEGDVSRGTVRKLRVVFGGGNVTSPVARVALTVDGQRSAKEVQPVDGESGCFTLLTYRPTLHA